MISFDEINDKKFSNYLLYTQRKREATAGAQVDPKGARITQQLRIVNATDFQ